MSNSTLATESTMTAGCTGYLVPCKAIFSVEIRAEPLTQAFRTEQEKKLPTLWKQFEQHNTETHKGRADYLAPTLYEPRETVKSVRSEPSLRKGIEKE